jgi:hypothetical protein
MTQAAVAPPTFVLFTDRDIKLHFSFERFLENRFARPSASRDADLVQGEGAEREEGRVGRGGLDVPRRRQLPQWAVWTNCQYAIRVRRPIGRD